MKPSKLILLLLLNFTLNSHSFSQGIKENGSKKEINLIAYTNFLYFNSGYNPRPYNFSKELFRFWGITPAISFRDKEKSIVHEFEPKFWATVRDNNNIEEYEMGLRYELNWYFKKVFLHGLSFRFGPSTRIYYYRADAKSDVRNGFPVKAQNGGIEFSSSVHFIYKLSKHFKIVITSNNFNLNFAIDNVYYDNPMLNERQKSQGGFDFDGFGQQILRLGIAYGL